MNLYRFYGQQHRALRAPLISTKLTQKNTVLMPFDSDKHFVMALLAENWVNIGQQQLLGPFSSLKSSSRLFSAALVAA